MKIICQKDLFSEGIASVQRAVALRTTLPILEGILLEAKNNLVLTGYNMELGIRYTMSASIKEEGSVVVPSRLLGEMIRRAPENEIEITVGDNENVTLTSGDSVFHFKGLPASSYPQLPEEKAEFEVELPQKELQRLIRQTIFSIGKDPSRPSLNGCYLKSTPDKVQFVGIDGFRVAISTYRSPGEGSFPEMDFIIPGTTLKELMPLLEEEGQATLFYNKNQLVIDFGRTRFFSRLIQETYMKYENFIPTSTATKIVLSSKEFLSSVERASIVAPTTATPDKKSTMTLRCDGPSLRIFSRSLTGEFNESIDVDFSGDTVDIDFSIPYFLDVLKVIPDEKITMGFLGETGPCLMESAEQEGQYLFMILPMRR